ncbi:MFS transporter [Lacihabitans sp. LS3-19]|nr:MFS transporter [Lacihabitans sp. LS3-19]
MSLGFLGIQMGFALQNGNASRILLNFGADVHQLSWFWVVAPLTGMIVQPIIGKMSDNTWTSLGRRRPFFLVGAILAAIGLLLMPNAGSFTKYLPALWVGAGFLMIMDASFNVAMEPFRALVADKLNSSQRTKGYAIQTALIGIGAVVGSWLPYVLTNWFGFNEITPEGTVPSNVIWSFVIGALFLLATIIWTISTTPEYTPQELKSFEDDEEEVHEESTNILADILAMPKTMKQLGVVQFFSWFGLFSMWVYTTSAVAQHIYGLPTEDHSSAMFNKAGDWVGIIFGVYNGVSAIYAFILPSIAKKIGRKRTHAFSLICGALGLISIYFAPNENFLLFSMIGVGIAWGSILAMPYAILGGALPAKKIGVYMGIFNLFITIPQILNAILGGIFVKYFFNDKAIYALILGGVCFLIAAISVNFVEDKDEVVAI